MQERDPAPQRRLCLKETLSSGERTASDKSSNLAGPGPGPVPSWDMQGGSSRVRVPPWHPLRARVASALAFLGPRQEAGQQLSRRQGWGAKSIANLSNPAASATGAVLGTRRGLEAEEQREDRGEMGRRSPGESKSSKCHWKE